MPTIRLIKDSCGDLYVDKTTLPPNTEIVVHDYTGTWTQNLRENVEAGAEDPEALDRILTDAHGAEYMEFTIDPYH